MPPVRACLFTAALLAAIVAGAPTHAEMTAADRASMHAFTTCLQKTVGNEEACLLRLGYQAWYPFGDAACESVVAPVHAALAADNQIEWENLFRNERCARLRMPHDTTAAEAGSITIADMAENTATQPYVSCIKEVKGQDICLERVGRHIWYPLHQSCHMLDDILEGDPQLYSWKLLFFNERCWRLGLPHIRPS